MTGLHLSSPISCGARLLPPADRRFTADPMARDAASGMEFSIPPAKPADDLVMSPAITTTVIGMMWR